MDNLVSNSIDWTTNPVALTTYGLAGGLVVALVLVWLHRRAQQHDVVLPPHGETISIGIINMAHIRVAGIGGLGLVAMCGVVAIVIPTIGLSLAAGATAGTALAIALIAERRRHAGPLPSADQPSALNIRGNRP